MWTVEEPARHDRGKLRYPTDLTDAEWKLAQAGIPRARRGGNERTVDIREVTNGLMYVLGTGCQLRAITKDLPPRSTVNHDFCRWQHDGTLDRLHHALYVLCRERAHREASPTAAIIDSQSVKSAGSGPWTNAPDRVKSRPGRAGCVRPSDLCNTVGCSVLDFNHHEARHDPGVRGRGVPL